MVLELDEGLFVVVGITVEIWCLAFGVVNAVGTLWFEEYWPSNAEDARGYRRPFVLYVDYRNLEICGRTSTSGDLFAAAVVAVVRHVGSSRLWVGVEVEAGPRLQPASVAE